MHRALSRWWRSSTAIATLFRLRAATRRRETIEARLTHVRGLMQHLLPHRAAGSSEFRASYAILRDESEQLQGTWIEAVARERALAERLRAGRAGALA